MKHPSSSLLASLTRLRDRLVPEALGLGWMPIFLLGYLVFLFVPVLRLTAPGGGGPARRTRR